MCEFNFYFYVHLHVYAGIMWANSICLCLVSVYLYLCIWTVLQKVHVFLSVCVCGLVLTLLGGLTGDLYLEKEYNFGK